MVRPAVCLQQAQQLGLLVSMAVEWGCHACMGVLFGIGIVLCEPGVVGAMFGEA